MPPPYQDSPNGVTGSCLCGTIRYSISARRIYNVVCHCTSCRRVTGSSFLTASIYPLDSLTITIADQQYPANPLPAPGLRSYVDPATDSGKPLTRHACERCSSFLFAYTPLAEQIVSVGAGTMDQVAAWAPDKEQYARNRAPWLPEFGDGVEGLRVYLGHPFEFDGEIRA